MKLRFSLFALMLSAVALLATSAQAQIGVYLNPVVTRVSISTADTGPYAFLGNNTTSRFFGGFDYGGYWDFLHQPGFNAGLDVRETVVRANNADLDTFSVAAHVAAKNTWHNLRPYAQLAVGAGRSKPGESVIRVTKFEYGIFAGVDYPINRHLDFRVVELGYGSVQTISSSIERASNCTTSDSQDGTPVTTCTSIPSANLFNMSSGLVFRFGK